MCFGCFPFLHFVNFGRVALFYQVAVTCGRGSGGRNLKGRQAIIKNLPTTLLHFIWTVNGCLDVLYWIVPISCLAEAWRYFNNREKSQWFLPVSSLAEVILVIIEFVYRMLTVNFITPSTVCLKQNLFLTESFSNT
jgi:hypothetical protein